jgi:hypothetical protein
MVDNPSYQQFSLPDFHGHLQRPGHHKCLIIRRPVLGKW